MQAPRLQALDAIAAEHTLVARVVEKGGATQSRRIEMGSEPYRIDTHTHILPKEWVEAGRKGGAQDAGGVDFPAWSPEKMLAVMDQAGIATAVTSIAAPGVYFGDAAAARSLAPRCNEISAKLIDDHPGRFGAFAVLPLPDVHGALEEMEYALDTLKLDGVVLL